MVSDLIGVDLSNSFSNLTLCSEITILPGGHWLRHHSAIILLSFHFHDYN